MGKRGMGISSTEQGTPICERGKVGTAVTAVLGLRRRFHRFSRIDFQPCQSAFICVRSLWRDHLAKRDMECSGRAEGRRSFRNSVHGTPQSVWEKPGTENRKTLNRRKRCCASLATAVQTWPSAWLTVFGTGRIGSVALPASSRRGLRRGWPWRWNGLPPCRPRS